MTLREHIEAVAKATGMRIGTTPGALANVPELRAFRDAIADDPDLKNRARAMLLSFDERVIMRDHIQRFTKAALVSALGEDHE